MKNIFFILTLMVPVAFSCNKKEDKAQTTDNNYIINGIHDVDFATTGSNILPLAITLNNGSAQQTVTLSVENLPDGITAKFEPVTGIPSFSTILTFSNNNATAGTYTVTITGSSTSGKKTYPIKVIVPDFNGFYLAGKPYTFGSAQYYSSSSFKYLSVRSKAFEAEFDLNFPSEGMPETPGTYTYFFSKYFMTEKDSVHISATATSGSTYLYYDYAPTTKPSLKMTLVIGSDKTIKSIQIPALDMLTEDGKTVTLSANIKN